MRIFSSVSPVMGRHTRMYMYISAILAKLALNYTINIREELRAIQYHNTTVEMPLSRTVHHHFWLATH